MCLLTTHIIRFLTKCVYWLHTLYVFWLSVFTGFTQYTFFDKVCLLDTHIVRFLLSECVYWLHTLYVFCLSVFTGYTHFTFSSWVCLLTTHIIRFLYLMFHTQHELYTCACWSVWERKNSKLKINIVTFIHLLINSLTSQFHHI